MLAHQSLPSSFVSFAGELLFTGDVPSRLSIHQKRLTSESIRVSDQTEAVWRESVCLVDVENSKLSTSTTIIGQTRDGSDRQPVRRWRPLREWVGDCLRSVCVSVCSLGDLTDGKGTDESQRY